MKNKTLKRNKQSVGFIPICFNRPIKKTVNILDIASIYPTPEQLSSKKEGYIDTDSTTVIY